MAIIRTSIERRSLTRIIATLYMYKQILCFCSEKFHKTQYQGAVLRGHAAVLQISLGGVPATKIGQHQWQAPDRLRLPYAGAGVLRLHH